MESKIAKHICLKNHPVAVLRADNMPEQAIAFKEGKWGCVVALIKAASQGKIAAAAKDTTVCMGGRAGLGVLYPQAAEEKGEKTCYIGMTDPSARKVISKEQMSFSIPYSRFLEMEQEADGCFFTTDTWETIKKRI